MRGMAVREGCAEEVIADVVVGKTKRRHGGRVVLGVSVEPEVRDALRSSARRCGVSMAEYLANVLAGGAAPHRQETARLAQPLSALSYRLAQMREARRRDDRVALDREIGEAQGIVTDALRSLVHEHAAEVERFEGVRNEWEGS